MITEDRLSVFLSALEGSLPDGLVGLEQKALSDGEPVIRRPMQALLGFLLRLARPESVLEIGTAVGFSSLLMSEYLPETVAVTTIEKVPARILAARQNFIDHGRAGQIELREGDAAVILPELTAEGRQYDFIFMDAAKGQYLNFLPDVERLCVENGLLVTDNVLQDGKVLQSRYAVTRRDRTIHRRMREYLYEVTHSPRWDTMILPVGDGATVSRRL